MTFSGFLRCIDSRQVRIEGSASGEMICYCTDTRSEPAPSRAKGDISPLRPLSAAVGDSCCESAQERQA